MSSILSSLTHSHCTKEITASWRAPSNIALVKYWGKRGHQIPANPSLSLTLSKSYTETHLVCEPSDKLFVEFEFEGKENLLFADKIKKFLLSISDELPFVLKTKFAIKSKNTFPHSAGIASSASGMAAFSLCLLDCAYQMSGVEKDSLFYIRASFLSRLASGSACRSLFGGITEWGQDSQFAEFSDTHATKLHQIHPEFAHLQDSILIASSEAKKISSRDGHERMGEHPFAEKRYELAKKHFHQMLAGLKSGDWDTVGPIIEKEALSLHAMMMTSPQPYILMKPKTIELIQLVTDFRHESKLPVYFTLDAGPNLHLIYPESIKGKVQTFLEHEAAPFIEFLIFDEEGSGPQSC